MKSRTARILLAGRAGKVRRAVASLRKTDGCRVLRVRANGVALATTRTPMGLLLEAKMLEAAIPGLRVELADYDGRRVRTPWLALPRRELINCLDGR